MNGLKHNESNGGNGEQLSTEWLISGNRRQDRIRSVAFQTLHVLRENTKVTAKARIIHYLMLAVDFLQTVTLLLSTAYGWSDKDTSWTKYVSIFALVLNGGGFYVGK